MSSGSEWPSLTLQAYAQPPRTFFERTLPTLKNVTDGLSNPDVVYTTRAICELWEDTISLWIRVRNDDLIRVCVNDQIRVVRHHDDLPSCSSRHKRRDEFIEHRLRIQILLRLVDNQRSVIVIIEREVKKQEHYAAGSRRQVFDVNTVVGNPVSNQYVICIEEPLREAPEPSPKSLVLITRYGSMNEKGALVCRNEVAHCLAHLSSTPSFPTGPQFSLRPFHERTATSKRTFQPSIEQVLFSVVRPRLGVRRSRD